MTRRRFFPMAPVQTVPGRSVELAVQLRPEAPPSPAAAPPPEVPPPTGEPDVDGVAWVWSLTGGDSGAEEDGPGRWYIYGTSDMLWRESIWLGTPALDANGQPVEGPNFRCTEITTDHATWTRPALMGIIQGSYLPDARWELQWSAASETDPSVSAMGHQVLTKGNMVWVVFRPIDWEEVQSTEKLEARAYCGNQEVGMLTLTIRAAA